MLQQIILNNFIIIEHIELDLKANMSVITGETGAGKSILIDAIKLALGSRLDTDVLKDPNKRCELSLVFAISDNSKAMAWLCNHDLEMTQECVLRRVINTDGRSRCYINNNPVTLQMANELGGLLLDIQGQHEFHGLLKGKMQRELLDEYAGCDELYFKVNEYYQLWASIKNKITTLIHNQRDSHSKHEFLSYQLQEFLKLGLKENELAQLEEEHKKLANADEIYEHCQQAVTHLGKQQGVLELLHQVIKTLDPHKKIYDTIASNLDLLTTSAIQIQEVHNDLRHLLSSLDLDPARLNSIENRMAELQQLARKHRVPPNQLLTVQQDLQQQLNSMMKLDESLSSLENELKDIEQHYFHFAKLLSESRAEAATKLSQLVTENMQNLGMEGGQFDVTLFNIDDGQPKPTGLEQVEFKIRANPGQSLQPLNKIASGGELSRISLAIQVIIAQRIEVPTLIFDEVDVGIGGKIAEIVGRLLRNLGKRAQILCITHLPQVAAQGNQHLRVEKSVRKGITKTQIRYLSRDEQIEEVARMLGGINITENTRAHAQEMLERV